MNPNLEGPDAIETASELNEAATVLKQYADWCDHPITRMVVRILEKRMNSQLGLVSILNDVPDSLVNRLYGGQCAGHWLLQDMLELHIPKREQEDIEADYGYPEALRRTGREQPAEPIEQHQEEL